MQSLNYNIHDILKFKIIRDRGHGLRDLINLKFSFFEVEDVDNPDITLNIGKFTPSNENCEDFTVEEWKTAYEKLMGGFEDLDEEEEESEEEYVDPEDLTKHGYKKDGFVVDDNTIDYNSDSDEEEEEWIPSQEESTEDSLEDDEEEEELEEDTAEGGEEEDDEEESEEQDDEDDETELPVESNNELEEEDYEY